MFQVRAKGQILDLQPDQEISLTFDNPLFETDRIPVALSTPITFPLTPAICKLFQFVPTLLMEPGVKKISADLLLNGIVICSGSLIFNEFSEDGLDYTFAGAEFEDVVSGNLTDIAFPLYENLSFSELVKNGRAGSYSDFGLPQIMRKELAGISEYRTSTNEKDYPKCSGMDKYANWLGSSTPYVVPAIKVKSILNCILPNVSIDGYELNRLLDALAILAPYKNKSVHDRYGVEGTKFLNRPSELDPPLECRLDLADAMPNMSIADFLTNLLKMTCSTLYCSGSRYVIRPNKSVLDAANVVDWSAKIADVYSCASELGQGYSFSFKNTGTGYKETAVDDPEQQADAVAVKEVTTMTDALRAIKASGDVVSVKHTPSGDIFSGYRESVYLYYLSGNRPTPSNRPQWNSLKTDVPLSDIAHQAGFDAHEPATENGKYDCSVNFEIPPCVPTEVYHYSGYTNEDMRLQVGLCSVTPVVDLPAIGGTRPDTVYVGLLLDNNFVDKGYYFSRPTDMVDSGMEMKSTLSLAIDGEAGLYERFHRPFAEWIQKSKCPRNVALDLSPADIANLRLDAKYLMSNRQWLIKSLELTMNTSSGSIAAEGEFIPA